MIRPRWPLLTLGLACGTAWACSDRALDLELEEVCRNDCERTKQCDPAEKDIDIDACTQDCIPRAGKIRMNCEASFELSGCLGTLSCEDYSTYLEFVDRKDRDSLLEGDYPCGAQNIVYLMKCQGW